MLTYNGKMLTYNGQWLVPGSSPVTKPFDYLRLYIDCPNGNGNLEAYGFTIWHSNSGNYISATTGYGDFTQTQKSGWYYSDYTTPSLHGWHDLTSAQIANINTQSSSSPFLQSFRYSQIIFRYDQTWTLDGFSFNYRFNSGLNLSFEATVYGYTWDATNHVYVQTTLGSPTSFSPTTTYQMLFLHF